MPLAAPPTPSRPAAPSADVAPTAGATDEALGGAGHRLPRWLAPLATALVLGAALVVLRAELAGARYHEITRAVRAMPLDRVAWAAVLTVVAYAILSGYDALALAYVKLRLPLRRVVATSAAAYAISQTLGFAAITGNAVRYRFWSAWGLTATEIGQAVGFVGATFTIGLLATCGLALTFEPTNELALLGVPPLASRLLGAVLLGVVAAYVAWAAARRQRPLAVRGWEFPVPGPGLAVAQLALAVVDWTVAAAVLWVLLPPTPGLGFLPFVGAFAIAQCAGLLAHTPGGVGVFEAAMVVLLRPYLSAEQTLATIIAYRGVYYLLPFVVALVALGAAEAARQRARLSAAADATTAFAARWVPAVLPSVLAAAVFIAGIVLLISGATPSLHHRVRELAGVLPLGVIELSHLVGSAVGVALLVLAWAIHRRLDAAYGLTIGLLGVGIVASLLKGLDWEEASALAAVLVVVMPSRRAFYRKAAVTSDLPSLRWLGAVALVVGASVWLGLFSFQHVEYASDLWWRFSVRGDAPRFLRATVVVVVALGAVALARLLRTAEADPALPDAGALDRAARVVRTVRTSTANVALLGDKALMFADDGEGFVQYGVAGRSWVAMGDPVAATPERRAELAWRFREEADRAGAWPVFYQVTPDELPLYIDLGLTFMKLGEEAHVPLARFAVPGGGSKWMKRALKEGEKHGLTFEVVPAERVAPLLPALRAVSDDWLGGKATREKGFSLGRFEEAFVARFPVAVVRHDDRIVAFANLWLGAPGSEIAPDLMRHRRDAPRGTMDFLFTRLLHWGHDEGWTRCNLGMAPLSGLEARQLAPLWARAGAIVAARGERFYNFKGLRTFKEKFDPEWEPRYLASPGGIALPRILTNVATLISGGLTGVVKR